VQYQWFISGGTITSSATGYSIAYTANGTSPLTLSVTAANSCGTGPAGARNVTVAPQPTAFVSGSITIPPGQSTTIHATLAGTPPWTVTWSDLPGSPTQTSNVNLNRTVSPQTTTTYTVSVVSDLNCNNGSSTGNAVVTIQNSLLAPAWLTATTQDSNTRVVRLAWAAVSGASYRMERKDCASCLWLAVGPNPVAVTMYDDTVPTTSPTAYLYRVIAVASGSSDSLPSPSDYAVTATLLFAETLATGTPIRGTHVQELRKAIDALRSLANLEPYMTTASPSHPDGWVNYNAPTGLILASHQTAMRAALDPAVFNLTGQHVSFTGLTPAIGVGVYAYHITQLRNAVK
jgi:hypothetical protein